jgi:DNA-binding HxlR family transcriptional regulator
VKSYHQYCALARGLDIVGERWTLLIVRELLVGPRRYSELLDGLPGIATNLLIERVRALEGRGVVARTADGRYRLTAWGEGLAEPLQALARWATPMLATPIGDDEFRNSWLALPVAMIFGGIDRRRPDVSIEVRVDGNPSTIASHDGSVRVEAGPAVAPDLVLAGPPDGILAMLMGEIHASQAGERGVLVLGDPQQLTKLRPPSLAENA